MAVRVEVLEKKGVTIYRMATLDLHGKPFMWVSSYLIDGLLIDCGFAHAKDEFLKVLDLKRVEKCLLSHHHEDHYGACFDLLNAYGIPVFSNKVTAFLVRSRIKLPPERRLVWGIPKPCEIQELQDPASIHTSKSKFQLIPSPGHCKNLISIYNPQKKLLFCTDAFINSIQSVIFNWEDAIEMLETLKKFTLMNINHLFLEDGNLATRSDLNQLIEYWTKIKYDSEKLLAEGFTSKIITRKIFGEESALKRMTGGDISRENLIRSLLELPALNARKKRKEKRKK